MNPRRAGDTSRPFYGESGAKERRGKLLQLSKIYKKLVEDPARKDLLERWLTGKIQHGVSRGFCYTCRNEEAFWQDYCIYCLKREGGIPFMTEKKDIEDAAEKAFREKRPFIYFNRALALGKCDLHPDVGAGAYVMGIHTEQKKDPLIFCGECGRFLLQELLRDFVRETENRQPQGQQRTFWGKDPLLKDPNEPVKKEAA
jgi:hypothetical protein